MKYGEKISNTNHERIEILTLGQFAVRDGDTDLSVATGRSYRLWDLFKFLITNRDRGIRPEVIVEALYPEQNYVDPQQALRTPVYRLRKILASDVAKSNPIVFSQGCYSWKAVSGYWLDIEEFEILCTKAQQLSSEKPREAITHYSKAIGLYKGEYLPECIYQDWVLPVRNYYRRLYLQSVVGLLDLLGARGEYKEMLSFCERAILLEPLEEELHVRFLHALIKEKKNKQALNHYGDSPSLSMRKLYKQMSQSNEEVNIISVHQNKVEPDGVSLSSEEMLRNRFVLETQRNKINEESVCIARLILNRETVADSTLSYHKDCILRILQNLVRQSDLVCAWGEGQIMIKFSHANQRQAEVILHRVLNTYNHQTKPNNGSEYYLV